MTVQLGVGRSAAHVVSPPGLGVPFRWALTLALLLPAPGLAQEGATLAGRALDDAGGSPIGPATVTVSDPATGQTLSGTLPDEDGRSLLVGLAPGEYTIHAS